ncbi:hypothetical protein ZIOFF_075551 [Zingiber officinale]|uniref:Uncharacterized protein n=1 Tax=Zingiber officinale TaxID=94328 RepID=A0A8J5E8F2_ZINOF|nr:hypothetical protein ZIOFF_075551 [Zingiber officinale]
MVARWKVKKRGEGAGVVGVAGGEVRRRMAQEKGVGGFRKSRWNPWRRGRRGEEEKLWREEKDSGVEKKRSRVREIRALLVNFSGELLNFVAKLKKLWDELGYYNDGACTCGVNNKRRKLMQFLMGLNESYNAIRGQLLLMNPLPDVSQAYSSIIKKKSNEI